MGNKLVCYGFVGNIRVLDYQTCVEKLLQVMAPYVLMRIWSTECHSRFTFSIPISISSF